MLLKELQRFVVEFARRIHKQHTFRDKPISSSLDKIKLSANTTLISQNTLPIRVVAYPRMNKMSTKRSKKRERLGPMPAASAGLLRFFEEETQGIKIRPELVVIMTVGLILTAVIARALF